MRVEIGELPPQTKGLGADMNELINAAFDNPDTWVSTATPNPQVTVADISRLLASSVAEVAVRKRDGIPTAYIRVRSEIVDQLREGDST